MTRIGLPSLHDLGANLISGDPSGWEPHDRAECPPPFLGHDREGTHYPRSRHGLHHWPGRPGRAATPRSLAAQRMSSRPRLRAQHLPTPRIGPPCRRRGCTRPVGPPRAYRSQVPVTGTRSSRRFRIRIGAGPSGDHRRRGGSMGYPASSAPMSNTLPSGTWLPKKSCVPVVQPVRPAQAFVPVLMAGDPGCSVHWVVGLPAPA